MKKEYKKKKREKKVGSLTSELPLRPHAWVPMLAQELDFLFAALPLPPPPSSSLPPTLLPSTPSSPLSVYPARIFVPSFSIIICTLSPSGFCNTMHKEEAEEYKYDRSPLKTTKNGNHSKKENAYVTRFL